MDELSDHNAPGRAELCANLRRGNDTVPETV